MIRRSNNSARIGATVADRYCTALVVVAVLCAALTGLYQPVAEASGGPISNFGIIYTRGLILGPGGKPIFAEFDSNGVASSIGSLPNGGEAIGELDGARVLDGASYRAIERTYRAFLELNAEGVALNASVMTADEYAMTYFDGIFVQQPDGVSSEYVRLPKVALQASTRYALIRHKDTIVDPNTLGRDGLILFQAPIDIRDGQLQTLDDNIVSVLLSEDGQVLHASRKNIGLRAAYIKPETGTGDPGRDHQSIYLRGDELAGGINGAIVESSLGGGSVSVDGRFHVIDFITPCPGFMYIYDLHLYAKIPFRTYDPQAPRPYGQYYFKGFGSADCVGYGEVPLGFSLGAINAQLAQQAIVATLSTPLNFSRIPVDIVMFNGRGRVVDEQGSTIPIEGDQSVYDTSVGTFTDATPERLDMDLDGVTDYTSEPGSVAPTGAAAGDTYVGVWFGTVGMFGYNTNGVPLDEEGNPTQPDLFRLVDQAADFTDRSLLRSISEDDLKETDLYVFRASNGHLITSVKGLDGSPQVQGVDAPGGNFFYRITVPGPRSGASFSGRANQSIEGWQRSLGISEALIGQQVDSLRPGESIKVVAINRATGYVGSATTQITAPTTGFLDFALDDIILRPPNLKLRAERVYDVQAGATEGQKRRYLVGSEGSALTSDTYVALYTEWLDFDGTPLPEELPGYSARVAKVVGENELAGVNVGSVDFFEVKPGTNLQLVKLQGDVLGTEHFYVHVHPKALIDQPDFGPGEGTGILQYRPSDFVPVRVPLYDEVATRRARNANTYQASSYSPRTVSNEVVYRWIYRPEMQFSVHELDISRIEGRDSEGNLLLDTDGDVINLLEADAFELTADYQGLQAFYNLMDSDFSPLAMFGPGRDLMFSLAGNEVVATTEGATSATFQNLGYINSVVPEDFLALNLIQNSDAANVLYEFAFLALGIGVDLDRDGLISFSRADRTSAELPFRFWINDDYDVVVNDGNISTFEETCSVYGGNYDDDCDEEDINNLTYLSANPGATSTANIKQFDQDAAENKKIESYRDLEDFAPLEILVPEQYLQRGGDFTIELEADVGVEINLFRAEWEEKPMHALDLEAARTHVRRSRFEYLDAAAPVELPAWVFDNGSLKLIFDVIDNTHDNNPKISLIVKENGNEVARDEVYVEFKEIRHLYEHYTAGDTAEEGTVPLSVHQRVSDTLTYSDDNPGLALPEHEDEYIMLVHGWRMLPWERRRFAETSLKRLYWQGYKGRFGFFSWPTEYCTNNPDCARLAQNYPRSEAVARRTGPTLLGLLSQLRSNYTSLNVFAHSMGNVVTSEALRAGIGSHSGVVDVYVTSQPAEVADAYDPRVPAHLSEALILALNSDLLFLPPDRYTFGQLPVVHAINPQPDPPQPVRDHYYDGIRGVAKRIVNFFNRSDGATGLAWEAGQVTKPDSGIIDGDEWRYIGVFQGNSQIRDDFGVRRGLFGIFFDDLFWTTDREEILAHIIPSRSRSLGTEPRARSTTGVDVAGEIARTVNVEHNYGRYVSDRHYHSAQFLMNNMDRQAYWNRLLDEFGLL